MRKIVGKIARQIPLMRRYMDEKAALVIQCAELMEANSAMIEANSALRLEVKNLINQTRHFSNKCAALQAFNDETDRCEDIRRGSASKFKGVTGNRSCG